MILDIHSHILPAVDDGAKNIEESLRLLEMEKANHITSVILTPHFYPDEITLEDFHSITNKAFEELRSCLKDRELPRVYLGAEILYFSGISKADGLEKLTLNGSKYLLIELGGNESRNTLFEDLLNLQSKGFIPIIAHIERYRKAEYFYDLVDFAIENDIIIQINASSVVQRRYLRTILKLLKSKLFCVVGTDTHSVTWRPPFMTDALTIISKKLGREYRIRLIANSQMLFEKIVGEYIEE